MNNNNIPSRNRTNTLLKWGISAWIPLILLTAVFSILQPRPVYAATIVVNTTDDEYGSGTGCSLREAIQAANNDATFGGCTAGSGDDIITLPAGTYTLSITGIGEEDNATGDLDIDSNITINGASASTTIIDGADIDRVIHILNTADTTLNNLTIQNGSINSGDDGYDIGGGIYHQSSGQLTLSTVHVLDNFANFSGGGFANAGNATVTDCTISENRSEWGAGISNLDSAAMMTISNTVVSTNTASGVGRGGGLNIDAGSVVIENSLFTGNVVTLTTFVEEDIDYGNGGGISNSDRLTITNSTLTNNSAARYGGGIFTFNTAAYTGSSVTISNSTISNNRTIGYNRDLSDNGGGIYISWGTVHMTNSTISGNRTNGGGSGIFVFGQGQNDRAALTIDNSTIANNVGSSVITYTYRAGVAMHNGTVHFDHTIMSNNAPFNCQEGNGEMTDDGHNLEYSGTISDTTCSDETGTVWTVQTNPNLGPLADNGGPTTASGQATFTHALLSGSAAIDAGGASCGVTTDQRGYTRPTNGNCDIGAYEVQPDAPEIDVQRPSPTSIPNNSTDNVGSQTTNTFNLTYVISNTGQLPLVITDTTATNFNNSGNFTVITAMPLTVTAGMTSSLQISFTATSSGVFNLDMDIENNDSNENPYNITIAGALNTPPIANGDAYDATENNTLTIAASGVLTNDTDAETNSLTAVLNANPTHGSLSLAGGGGFTYTPVTDYCGADSFTYHANDSMDNSNIATVTLNVICTQELTVGLAGTGSGSVTSDPTGINCGVDCSQGYLDGTAVTFTAAPNASTSTFTGWTGACSGTGDCHVTMTEARAVTATFALISRTLTVGIDGSGGGSVSSSPAGISCEGDCSESYNHGTAVTLSPTAVSGSSFAGWAGACTGDGACVVSMTQAQHVTATFTLGDITLTVQKSGVGDGLVTSTPAGIRCGFDCTHIYENGKHVTLSAAPNNDSTFTEWTGACSGSGSCTVTMNGAQNVTAVFSPLHPAGTINVNTTVDEYGVSADCSLREAIQSANTDTAFGGCNTGNGDDTIALPAGTYTLTRIGTDEDNNVTGDLDISSNIIIAGNGADLTFINGNAIDRVLHTHDSNNLTINNTTIQNGHIGTLGDAFGSNSYGGGLYHESDGNLTLNRVAILNNFAGHRGGGVDYRGNAIVINSTISGNDGGWGGGLVSTESNAVMTITNSIVSNNTAHERGGGLNIYDGTVHINRSLFMSNTVDAGDGGGVANSGTLDIRNSTFSSNTASADGGGIYSSTPMIIENSTISGNSAPVTAGIYTEANLTSSHNSIVYNNGTGIFQASGAVTIDNSIVANNTANCNNPLTDNGHNLEYPGTTCGGFTVQSDPSLKPLADNRGYLIGAELGQSILTHALLFGTPAVDAGSCGTFVTDQRGFSRPQYAACDIGSFELQKPAPEMDVQLPSSTSIPNGGSDDMGSSPTTAFNLDYIIDNSMGTLPLVITNTTTSAINNIADFTVITPMPLTVAEGEKASVNVSFTVPADGAFSVDMNFINNDEDESSYRINIKGAVNTAPAGFTVYLPIVVK